MSSSPQPGQLMAPVLLPIIQNAGHKPFAVLGILMRAWNRAVFECETSLRHHSRGRKGISLVILPARLQHQIAVCDIGIFVPSSIEFELAIAKSAPTNVVGPDAGIDCGGAVEFIRPDNTGGCGPMS